MKYSIQLVIVLRIKQKHMTYEQKCLIFDKHQENERKSLKIKEMLK
jgi:hypothetical protein